MLTDILMFYLTYTFFVWIFFVVAIKSKQKLEEKYKDNKFVMYTFNLFVGLPFVIFDFIFNIIMTPVYTLMRVGEMGLLKALNKSFPDFKGARYHIPLFTHRLQQSIMKDDMKSTSFKFSKWFCEYAIEPHDPGHCKLYNIRLRLEQKKKEK